MHLIRSSVTVLLAVALAATTAACGGDDADTEPSTTAEVTTTVGSTTTVADAPDTSTSEEADAPAHADPAALVVPDDVCALTDDAAASAATGVTLVEGTPDGNGIRNVCAFSPRDNDGVGITIGVQSGEDFDDKAERSEDSLGAGEVVADLGDQALFFYDAEPEADLGGVLVAVGGLTVDVTIQGIGGRAETLDASTALATLVVDGL